jgi:hypothetical protein
LTFGLLGGALLTAFRIIQSRREMAPVGTPAWPPMPDTTPVVVPERSAPAVETPAPKPPAKKAAAKKKAAPPTPWVEPVDGACPGSHPVKGKLTSSIFHVPGGFNYPRTKPDRCYLDAAAAEADGLRPSKR